MEIRYHLTEADYLAFQMAHSALSKHAKKTRKRLRLLISILYPIVGLVFLTSQTILGIIFILVGLAWYFLYPKYSQYRYRKILTRQVKENFKDYFGKSILVKNDDDGLYYKGNGAEGKVNYNKLTRLIETTQHYFLYLNNNSAHIFPKDSILSDELQAFLQEVQEQNPNIEQEFWDGKKWM